MMIPADPVKRIPVFVIILVLNVAPVLGEDPNWRAMRMQMMDEIEADMRTLVGHGLNPAVAKAIGRVARHEFVPMDLQYAAYQNRPLPIGAQQTISQPFIVALMTDLLAIGPGDKVLEVGTGSGYQAAVLGELCDSVFTVEIIAALADDARLRLARLGYTNIHVKHGDGTLGWEEQAPFDGIIVTAAGIDIPPSLIDQLRIGGRLVIPIGPVGQVQQLKLIHRTSADIVERDVLPVRFVPITEDVR